MMEGHSSVLDMLIGDTPWFDLETWRWPQVPFWEENGRQQRCGGDWVDSGCGGGNVLQERQLQ